MRRLRLPPAIALLCLLLSASAARATVTTVIMGGPSSLDPNQAAACDCFTPYQNYSEISFQLPGLPYLASPAGAFTIQGGSVYKDSVFAAIGLNKVIAKVTRNPGFWLPWGVFVGGQTYHAQWDLYWDDGTGHQASNLNSLNVTAYPYDTIYMAWYGLGWDTLTHTAFITVYKPDGTLRQSVTSNQFGFATSQEPNSSVYPTYAFTTDSAYSCQDMPAPYDDVSFNGSLTLSPLVGQPGYIIFQSLAMPDTFNNHCRVELYDVGDGTQAINWHAH